ncbi:hypothetical protein SISNIDRAFT_475070 [Sistotremastrum niveocremeum HHB9708]|uniref:CCHC-type domain-containing protein n=1 Tax=Sistotremastrum niveocremeum HHB9708 TaxID=1314777 RepID=A0A164S6B6_9AGAM|nr:hypothetical protein SISNIDRAFT_475070 [Sistotremastrum niveocremeum HHB9708]
MAFQYPKKVGHIAENCVSQERLCYNCRQPGHESSACPSPRSVSTKQCYSCGGVGHISADCPTVKLQQASHGANGGQKCYSCGRFGHIARNCPTAAGGGGGGFSGQRPAPSGRGLNNATIPPIKCYRCGGLNHMSR